MMGFKSYLIAMSCVMFFLGMMTMFLLMGLLPPEISTSEILKNWDSVYSNTTVTSGFTFKNHSNNDSEYLLDTPGCRIENILLFDKKYKEIFDAFQIPKIPKCNAKNIELTYLDMDKRLHINQSVQRNSFPTLQLCRYTPFYWSPKNKNDVLWGKSAQVGNVTEIKDEFILVECLDDKSSLIYRNVHSQVIRKSKNIMGRPLLPRTRDEKDQMNLIIFAVDSTSRPMFLRHCPELHEYITKELGGVMLEGFNKLGDNTLSNIYPMLTGRHLMSDLKSLLISTFDDWDWTWRDFMKKGYVNLIAEEVIGVYHPRFVPRGFKKLPTDHYHRPVRFVTSVLKPAIPEHETPEEAEYCYGPKQRTEEMIDWIYKFTKEYKDYKFSTFSFISNATHNSVNDLGKIKHLLFKFFRTLNDEGILENTAIIFHSDHGFRMGSDFFRSYVGAYEARLPFMYVIVPKNFQHRHKTAYNNLKTNAHRLTTFFDIHQIVHDIAAGKFPGPIDNTGNSNFPGLSLFGEIPSSRTCSDAGIETHWCACGSYISIPRTDKRAQKAGEILLAAINKYNSIGRARGKCITFTEYKVIEAKTKVHSSGDGYSKISDQKLYITIEVEPHKAQYRSTIALDQEHVPTLGHLERLEKYGTQPMCLSEQDPIHLLTCICKSWDARAES